MTSNPANSFGIRQSTANYIYKQSISPSQTLVVSTEKVKSRKMEFKAVVCFDCHLNAEVFLKIPVVIFVISIVQCIGLDIISTEFRKKNFSISPYTTPGANFFEKKFFFFLNDFETLFHSEFYADSEYECLSSQFFGPKTCLNGTRPLNFFRPTPGPGPFPDSTGSYPTDSTHKPKPFRRKLHHIFILQGFY